jgi:putative tryptophan/tyrosine transport system substrate-binding protein
MPERYAELVADLIALHVDVVVASGPMLALLQKATSSIPVVMSHGEDPLGEGLIQSLAHPGGNFTGLSGQLAELNGKRLELQSPLRRTICASRKCCSTAASLRARAYCHAPPSR